MFGLCPFVGVILFLSHIIWFHLLSPRPTPLSTYPFAVRRTNNLEFFRSFIDLRPIEYMFTNGYSITFPIFFLLELHSASLIYWMFRIESWCIGMNLEQNYTAYRINLSNVLGSHYTIGKFINPFSKKACTFASPCIFMVLSRYVFKTFHCLLVVAIINFVPAFQQISIKAFSIFKFINQMVDWQTENQCKNVHCHRMKNYHGLVVVQLLAVPFKNCRNFNGIDTVHQFSQLEMKFRISQNFFSLRSFTWSTNNGKLFVSQKLMRIRKRLPIVRVTK